MFTYDLTTGDDNDDDQLCIRLNNHTGPTVLHFGVGTCANQTWTEPPPISGAKISNGFGEIDFDSKGEARLRPSEIYPAFRYLYFVLHRLSDNAWIKPPTGGNFVIDFQIEAELAKLLPPPSQLVSVIKSPPNMVTVAHAEEDQLRITVHVRGDQDLTLHWGFCNKQDHSAWLPLERSSIREPTQVLEICKVSCRVPMLPSEVLPHWRVASIFLHPPEAAALRLAFLYFDRNNHWYKNPQDPSGNFILELPSHSAWEENIKLIQERRDAEAAAAKAAEIAKKEEEQKQLLVWQTSLQTFLDEAKQPESGRSTFFEVHKIEGGEVGAVEVNVEQSLPVKEPLEDPDSDTEAEEEQAPEIPADSLFFVVSIRGCFRRPLTLHWGVVGDGQSNSNLGGWRCPDQAKLDLPQGTQKIDDRAAQSPLTRVAGSIYSFNLRIPATYSTPYLTPNGISGIAFVLLDRERNEWFKIGSGDFVAVLRPIKLRHNFGPVADQIYEAEVLWSSMTLMHRYNLCVELISKQLASGDKAAETDFWAWMYVWNRFNQLGWLTWQKNYNTKPKDMAYACERLSTMIGDVWKDHPSTRRWTSMIVPTIGRGGSGQAIRDVILDIMHKHKIPETSGHFYEQWHQKLHNNTTPDDVGICKALIQYLRSGGNMRRYWEVLKAHRIDRERLASYERPILHEPYWPPCDVNALVIDLENYLNILVDIHDAADIERAVGRMHHAFSDEIRHITGHVLHAVRNPHDVDLNHAVEKMIQIAAVRSATAKLAAHPERCSARDALTLNSTLETSQSIILQRARKGASLNLGTAVEAVIALVGNWVENDPFNEEWQAILQDWKSLGRDAVRHAVVPHEPVQNALVLKALLDRMTRAVGEMTDEFQTLLGPRAKFLGEHLGMSAGQLDVFVDEVVRGSSLFSMSKIVKAIEPEIRKQAHLPPWQLISPVHQITGRLKLIKELHSFQESVFEEPTIMISDAVNGEEDIPEGVIGVLVRSSEAAPDILSHVAVRARNAKVLLAVCFEPDVIAVMEKEADHWVTLEVGQGGSQISMRRATVPTPEIATATEEAAADVDTAVMDLEKQCQDYVIGPSDFNQNVVGSKSVNLVLLSQQLGSIVKTPSAVALPYGCFQKCLNDEARAKISEQLQKILKVSHNFGKVERYLKQIRKTVLSMPLPDSLYTELIEKAASGPGKIMDKLPPKEECERAIREVWASLFGSRPYVALHKAQRNFQDLSMAVLCQNLIMADYAFVLHTANPFAENGKGELYGELVQGLGETLVGNYPGRALSWIMKRDATKPKIIAYPSKSTELVPVESLIFRSDSNGEDLEGFAGAGLFESIPTSAPVPHRCLHSKNLFVVNEEEGCRLLHKISQLAFEIEDMFGQAMDIEGVLETKTKSIVIVQARPQV